MVGYDFTYGKGRTGTPQQLKALGKKLGFGVDIVEPVANDGVVFSSSKVRDHLRQGELEEAAEQLGYWWRVRGKVERGAGRGKGLGFPTANLPLAPGQDIAHGIYAVRVEHKGKRYPRRRLCRSAPDLRRGTAGDRGLSLQFRRRSLRRGDRGRVHGASPPRRDLRQRRRARRADARGHPKGSGASHGVRNERPHRALSARARSLPAALDCERRRC